MHGDTLYTDETGMESQKESGKTKRKKSPFAVWLHRQSDAFLSLSLVHHSREEWMSKRGHESNLRKRMEKRTRAQYDGTVSTPIWLANYVYLRIEGCNYM